MEVQKAKSVIDRQDNQATGPVLDCQIHPESARQDGMIKAIQERDTLG